MLGVVVYTAVTEPVRMEAQVGNWDGREIEKGAMLYHNNCTTCHGVHGGGGPAPALNSHYFFTQRITDVGWAGAPSDYVKLTIAAGRPNLPDGVEGDQWVADGVMPTWSNELGGPLRGDQIDALTAYVMNWESSAIQQTPAEDPWIFFEKGLAKGLPYDPDDDGYQQKLDQAIAAAKAAGETSYEIEGETYEFEVAAVAKAVEEEDLVRSPQELYSNAGMGCVACHNLNENQTPSNIGPVGPHQGNLHETAKTRVDGQSAEEYVYESIVNPGAYVVDGYAGSMPGDFAERMSEEEIRGLAAWMLDPNREQ